MDHYSTGGVDHFSVVVDTIEQLSMCAEKITVILKGNKTKDALTITKNLFYFLGTYGDLVEVVDEYYGKIKASIKRESAVIVTPNCDSISKFLSANGLLNICFSKAK